MTLATHIVIAAAVAKPLLIIHPALGIAGALVSHYLADAIPHWDYRLRSLPEDIPEDQRTYTSLSDFLYDLAKMAFDAIAGAVIVFAVFRPFTLPELLFWSSVIIAGVFPDFLQGIYYSPWGRFLKPIHAFHDYMHTKIKLGPYPLVGVPVQAAIFFFFLSTII